MRQKRILIVEDDAGLRRMYQTALAGAGYLVEEAADGLEALRIVEAHAPDLVVLDLTLHAVDGLSVQEDLAGRALTSQIPIVIVTGSDAEVDALNVACLLRKPIMPDELVEAVQSCLHEITPGTGT
jgi:DNA-binding response OmpR family regulator